MGFPLSLTSRTASLRYSGVQPRAGLIELWAGDRRLVVHARSMTPGKRFPVPGQWAGLSTADRPAPREAMAVQLPIVEVERRSLAVYDEALGVAG